MICSTWPGRSVRTDRIASNGVNDRTARRTTQTHVRKRSDVLRWLVRICAGIMNLAELASPAPEGLAKLRPKLVREPLPPPKVNAPPLSRHLHDFIGPRPRNNPPS